MEPKKRPMDVVREIVRKHTDESAMLKEMVAENIIISFGEGRRLISHVRSTDALIAKAENKTGG